MKPAESRACPPLTVVVSSCDRYADCWPPFFQLLAHYWPERNAPVRVITEQARADGFGEGISAFAAAAPGERVAWSECLRRCLEAVTTPYVLYLQEDYYLEAPVDDSRIQACIDMMETHGFDHIGLTHFGGGGPFRPSGVADWLWEVGRWADYRINTQAGLWRREVLLRYCVADESGWQFEKFGTWRSWRRRERFATLNRDQLRSKPCMLYTGTGIIRGQWHPAMPALFARHGIEVDFEKRGFYRFPARLVSRFETMLRTCRMPVRAGRALLLGW